MSKKSKSLTSEEAILTFKKEIGNCLGLLGFLNSKDKENLWKFWKTVSSAVKIAVNGKGDIISSSIQDSNQNGRKDLKRNKEEILRLKNLPTDATTIYVPMSSTDRGSKRYQVFKFLNQKKIEEYIEIIETDQKSEHSEVIFENGEFHSTPNLSEITISPDKIIAQISEQTISNSVTHGGSVSEVCDEEVKHISVSSSSYLTPVVSSCFTENLSSTNNLIINQKGLDDMPQRSSPFKKQKTEVKTWPVRKPTTRLSSHAKARNSILNIIPLKMREDNAGNKVNKIVNSDINEHVKIYEDDNISVSKSGNENSKANQNAGGVQQDDNKALEVAEEEKQCDKVQSALTITEHHGSNFMPQPDTCLEVLSEMVVGDVDQVKMNSEADIDKLRETLIKTECNSNGSQIVYPVMLEEETLVHSSSVKHVELKVEESEMDSKSTISTADKSNPIIFEEQQVNTQGLPHKSSSDIETIISALEEELKKANDSSQDLQSPREEVVQLLPGQEIVEVQNVEDVIWNTDGSVQVVGTHTLIDTSQTVTTVVNDDDAVINPIDAQYDVVEYEVLAEKGKTRKVGGKKRKRDKELQSEEKDVLDRTCPMCHRVLTYPSSMAAHMRIHTGDRPYSCGQCDRKFTTKANRDRHEATHVGLKPFKCSECEKCFTEKRSLKIHMRSHTGERPFVCTVCGRGFAQKCTLMVHMDRHTNRKGHLCDLCGKAFRQKCQLDIHVKRHNRQANYPCPECSVKCYTKGDLMRHMIKHTGERPFHCTLCPRTFTRKQYLVDHENTHYGRKPYKCSVCSMAFHDMGSCHRHIRKHREEEESNEGEKTSKVATILTADDYDTIVKGSQAGKILTLEDGTQALVTAVDTEADGSTVYHITCVSNQQEDKADETNVDKADDTAVEELNPQSIQ